MTGINDLLIQLFQPYFFYPLFILTFFFLFTTVFLKLSHLSHKYQSVFWLLPLFFPLITFFIFPPQAQISINPFTIMDAGTLSSHDLGIVFLGSNFFSITGFICISGILFATGYFSIVLIFGKNIALRRFHVVMMEKEEYPLVQQQVTDAAHTLGIAQPNIGLVDDLIPNAFTTGHGRNAVIVFSLGLLELLNSEELLAVISHELAHIKSQDYLFKCLANALNILSFYNPLAYIANSKVKKERELLADEKGAALLERPLLMAAVLTKIDAVMYQFPKLRLADQLSTSLFLVTPLSRRHGVLSSHPTLSQRVRNIQKSISKTKKPWKLFPAFLFLIILISATMASTYSGVIVQEKLSQIEKNLFLNGNAFSMYNNTISNNANSLHAITSTNETLRNLTCLPQQDNFSITQ